jgi:hypothetical protein
VCIDTDEPRVIDETIEALADHPDIFQRAGELVEVIAEPTKKGGVLREAGAASIAPIQLPRLREMCSHQVDFQTWREGKKPKAGSATEGGKSTAGYTSVHAPLWVTQQVAARGQWKGIRLLEAVTSTPTLRPDGSVVERPGYDEATGILFRPTCQFPRVPTAPTHADAAAAAALIMDIFCDFPIPVPEHRAAVLAGVLTTVARHAFAGPAPLTVIDKNVHGAGGSRLADAIATAATGRAMARMTQAKDDDEERKRILSIALAGDSSVLIDNVDRPLGGAALDSALTGDEWRDRVLGESRMVRAPLSACWFATGNNITILRDTLRRVLLIRIETPLERPEERLGFKYDPLIPHVKNEHPHLVVAALTILRAFVVAGRPDAKLKPWGSFEGWSALIRNAIVFAGHPDPAGARAEMVTSGDTEAAALRTVLENWRALDQTGTGTTAASILETIAQPHGNDTLEALKAAFAELAPLEPGAKTLSPKSLGKRLAQLKGRVVGRLALESEPGRLGLIWSVKGVRGGT